MSTIRNFLASVLFASVALVTTAQAQTAPAASMPRAGQMMSHDCAKQPSRHDHGAERNVPRAKSASAGPCAAMAGAPAQDAAASSPMKQRRHDHAKFKNL
jgi:hypothetical protein